MTMTMTTAMTMTKEAPEAPFREPKTPREAPRVMAMTMMMMMMVVVVMLMA